MADEKNHEHKDGGHKHDGPKLDLKTQRRVLRFINGARNSEELVYAPERIVTHHAEFRERRQPNPHDIHEGLEHEPMKLLKREQAKRLLTLRDRVSPLYGFLNLEELLRIRDFDVFLHDLSMHLSAAAAGEWQGPFTIPAAMDRPVHAALLRTGDVLFFGGLSSGTVTYRYTPDAAGGLGTFTPVASAPGDSLFCCGHVFLSDGKLLAAGGGGDGTGARHNHAWIFDPGTDAWTRTGDLNEFRWYPTLVNLGDQPGRILAVSGQSGFGDVPQPEPQATMTSVKDATLYEDATGALSNGAGQHMFTGTKGAGRSVRALVAFDVAGKVPEGMTLTAVKLRLNLSAANSASPQTVGLHRVLADWGEGSTVAPGGGGGGGPAAEGGATWLHTFFPDKSWSRSGGDVVATPSASVEVAGLRAYEWESTGQLVADVQMWLDNPSSNHGWLLMGDDNATVVKRFDTRENAGEANRPSLTLTFERTRSKK